MGWVRAQARTWFRSGVGLIALPLTKRSLGGESPSPLMRHQYWPSSDLDTWTRLMSPEGSEPMTSWSLKNTAVLEEDFLLLQSRVTFSPEFSGWSSPARITSVSATRVGLEGGGA